MHMCLIEDTEVTGDEYLPFRSCTSDTHDSQAAKQLIIVVRNEASATGPF